jgi:hypothetical protein
LNDPITTKLKEAPAAATVSRGEVSVVTLLARIQDAVATRGELADVVTAVVVVKVPVVALLTDTDNAISAELK